jgi:tyrosine-protein kinase
MTLTEYGYALRKRWLTILMLTILGAAGGFVVAESTSDLYRSTGSLLITSSRGDNTSELTQGSTFVQGTIPSYVVMATSDVVLQPVIDDLELHTTPGQLATIVTASSPLDTTIIEVSVINGSAKRAQLLASAVMSSLATQIPHVSPASDAGRPSVTVTTLKGAKVPKYPFEPNTRLSTAIGALLGLVVGIAYALGRRLFGDHISGSRDVAQLTDTPVLGQIMEAKRNSSLTGLILTDPLSPEAESVRALAANLNFLRIDGGLKSVVVTSAGQGEGKSTLALALGLVVAESGKRVLLIDADLRRPSIARSTRLEGSVGLTGVLLGDVMLSVAAEPWGDPNLTILTSGVIPPNPSQLLSSQSMRDLIAVSEEQYDLVVIDTGPLLSVSDAIWLSHSASGALLVAKWGRTTRRRFARALAALEGAEARVLGIVLSRKPRRGARRYEYATTAGAGAAGFGKARVVTMLPQAPPLPPGGKTTVASPAGVPDPAAAAPSPVQVPSSSDDTTAVGVRPSGGEPAAADASRLDPSSPSLDEEASTTPAPAAGHVPARK